MAMSRQLNSTVFHPAMTARVAARGLETKDVFHYKDDFYDYYDTTPAISGYAESSTDSPTVSVGDAAGGQLTIVTGGTNNNEGYLSTMRECWIFNTTKRVSCAARIQLTEASTSAANWCFGLSDTVGDDTMLDNGAGMCASFDGAVLYKVDGTMEIHLCTSNAASQTNNDVSGTSIITPVTAYWYQLYIDYDPNDGTTAKVNASVYDETNSALHTATEHDLTISGLQEMHLLLGVKAGSGNAETLYVDYIEAWQER